MSSKISLWTGLIGIGATIALVQPIAAAKSSVEIGDTAKAITVLITEPEGVGSGVILQQQGEIYTVLTAAHVVRNKVNYTITTPDDRTYQVISSSIRPAPGNIDLAVVKFKSTTKYPTAKLGNCNVLKSGMDLYLGGFPWATKVLTASIFVLREGKVSANTNKIVDGGYSLLYNIDTLPGMSGGAVLNSEGELVAIHGRGGREQLSNGDFGRKNGFNFGIPINRFAMVATNMGVELDRQVAPIPQNTAPKAEPIVTQPSNAEGYYRQGDKNADAGNYREAIVDFSRSIALNARSAQAYIGRGRSKYQLQDYPGAISDYQQALSIDPQYASAYFNLGLVKAKSKDLKGAILDMQRAAKLYQQQGKQQDARDAIAQITQWKQTQANSGF